MKTCQVVGPDVSGLRSFRAGKPGVPVFDQLEEKLTGDTPEARYVCAVLSTWAYSDPETVAIVMARLGLEKCRVLQVEVSNNATLIRSTGYLVQSRSGAVALLAYRGTDPFDLSTWAVSGDANPATVIWPEPGQQIPQAAKAAETGQKRNVERASSAGRSPTKSSLASSIQRKVLDDAQSIARSIGLGDVLNVLEGAADSLEDARSFRRTAAQLGAALTQVAVDANTENPSADPKQDGKLVDFDQPRVHAGFYRNQRASWFKFARALMSALQGKSIFEDPELGDVPVQAPENALKRLYVTGHSLGGAMSLLAAYRVASDPLYTRLHATLQHVYSFAPPRVGNGPFASAFNKALTNKVSCFVYKKDVVPRLPPEIPGTLNFQHVGTFYGIDRRDDAPPDECKWVERPAPERAESAGQLLLSFAAALGEKLDVVQAIISVLRRRSVEEFAAKIFKGAIEDRRYSIYDHFPERYMTVSQLLDKKHSTELGDDA